MPREGNFRIAFDPDWGRSVPRPFRLQGEGKGKQPIYPHGAKRPKKISVPTARQSSPLKLYPNGWLKNLPHLRKIKQRNAVVAPRLYSQAMARLITKKSKARAGWYIKVKVGSQWNSIFRRFDPIYEWDWVPQEIYNALFRGGTARYATDPKRLMPMLRFLYRYGYMKDYRIMVTLVKRRTAEIRRDAKAAWATWAKEYNRIRDRILKRNRDDRNRWNVH